MLMITSRSSGKRILLYVVKAWRRELSGAGRCYIVKLHSLILIFWQNRRLSNGLIAASAVEAAPTIESAIANGGPTDVLPALRPINVIASEAKQSILSLPGEFGLLRYARNDVVTV
jgi:hypothetical protein